MSLHSSGAACTVVGFRTRCQHRVRRFHQHRVGAGVEHHEGLNVGLQGHALGEDEVSVPLGGADEVLGAALGDFGPGELGVACSGAAREASNVKTWCFTRRKHEWRREARCLVLR